MSPPAIALTVFGCMAYLAVGFALAEMVTFGGNPSNRALRGGLRLTILIGWLPMLPLYYAALLIGWVFS